VNAVTTEHNPRTAVKTVLLGLALLSLVFTSAPAQESETPPTTGRTPAPGETVAPEPPAAEEPREDQEQGEDPDDGTEDKDRWLDKWARFRKALRDISEMDYNDGMFRGRFGLRFQVDAVAGAESFGLTESLGDGAIDDGLHMRRLRLFVDGDFARRFHYRFEYDFAKDKGLKDAYVDDLFRGVFKFFALRAGNIQEPFSLEKNGSSNFNGFLEDSLPTATIAPGRNFGYMFHGHHKKDRISWAFGMFTNTQTTDDNRSTSDFTISTRASGLPLYKQDGRRLLHVGASGSRRNPNNDTVSYGSRPETRWSEFFIATGDIAADANQLLGLEIALIHGPYWVQAEWLEARPDSLDYGELKFQGSYVEVGHFLTGDVRPYNHLNGTIGRLEPDRPYSRGGNPFKKGSNGGALELAFRLSNMDLNDGAIQGGEMTDATVSMNWYLSRATRFQFNYTYADVRSNGHANIVQIRYQFNPGYHWPMLHPKRRTVWKWDQDAQEERKQAKKDRKAQEKAEKERKKQEEKELKKEQAQTADDQA
jgi:phosphate-selective porin OprO/OprP